MERRLAAIMFADVVGYTALMAESEAKGLRARERLRAVVGPLVAKYHGELIEASGDESLVVFSTALDAVNCALALEETLADEDGLRLHIGIHLGDLVVERGEVSGDAVNIAARIRSFIETGVCVSGEVYHSVRNQPHIEARALGEHAFKNVGRPVALFALRGRPGAPSGASARTGAGETAAALFARPAIAVLPFDNLSADREQEYFADGIVEDLITRLANLRLFPVIARNSSFAYRGAATDVKRIGRELGARYLIEGSVRRAEGRVRVTAQLIDASDGRHVWADRFERAQSDVFALQDEIAQAIVAAVDPSLRRAEAERAARRDPASLDAWECLMRGAWHAQRFTPTDHARAIELYERSIELDPGSSLSHAYLVGALNDEIFNLWTTSRSKAVVKLHASARAAVELDPNDPLAHCSMAIAHNHAGESEAMIASLERAVRLAPSQYMAHKMLGEALATAGRGDEALRELELARRLSPHEANSVNFAESLAGANFVCERFEEAAKHAAEALQRRPGKATTIALLAACYGHLGRPAEAKQTVAGLPESALEALRKMPNSSAPAVEELWIAGLRRAGLIDG